MYPSNIIDRQIKNFLHNKISNNNKKKDSECKINYYKLPYLGKISTLTKKKISSLCKKYCKSMNIQIVFLPFKIGNLFSPKDPLPDNLRSYVVYKYICPGCNACVMLVKLNAIYQLGLRNIW